MTDQRFEDWWARSPARVALSPAAKEVARGVWQAAQEDRDIVLRARIATQGTGVCLAPSPNTINFQAYGADGKMASCGTRSTFSLSEDLHVMDAALEFNNAAKRGVLIEDFALSNLRVSTVPVSQAESENKGTPC